MAIRALTAALLLLGLAGCGAPAAPGVLPVIPEVQTADFLPAVHQQLDRLREAVKENPRSASAAGKLGMAYMAYRQYDAAVVALERAQLLQPRKWQWQYLRAIALTELGDYATAIALLEQTAGDRPGELMVRTRLGLAHSRMGELEKAEGILSAVVAEDPEQPEAVIGLTRALIKLDRPAEAQPHLERLLVLYGPSATTYFALAEASRLLGQTQKSQEYYELFRHYSGVGLPSRDKVYSEVRRLDRSEKLLVREARRLIALGESDKAISVMLKALAVNPDSVMIRASLISAYGTMKQFDQVEEHYRIALESGPATATLLRALGQARVYENRFDEARSALQRSLELNPQDAATHTWLGITNRGQGRNTAALASFTAALEIDPRERTARLNMADLMLRARRFDEAIHHSELLLLPESDTTVTALLLLGQAFASQGNVAAARMRFNEAIDVARRRDNGAAAAHARTQLARLP